MKLDDPIPYERRSTRRETSALTRPPLLPLGAEEERAALERAMNLQRILSYPEEGAALEQVDGFVSGSGEWFRCLPGDAGAVDVELHMDGAWTLLRGVHIGPQRLVRDAPLALLSEASDDGTVGLVVYISSLQRFDRRTLDLREDPPMTHENPTTEAELSAVEPRIKALCEREAWDEAMELIGLVHGPVVRGLLIKKLQDEAEAHEVWLSWFESVRRALAKFRWESRFSTWSYRVALNAFFAHKRKQSRARPAMVQLNPEVRYKEASGFEGRDHDPTYDWVKTTNIQHFRSICEEHLKEEDQRILQWRLHESRSWSEIARELGAPDMDDAELKKSIQRLHVRFHRLVKRLHKLAVREGLVSPELDTP